MSEVLGFNWIVRWSNPHTSPPDGMPCELKRVYVPNPHKGAGAGPCPREIEDLHRQLGFGSGWGVFCGHVEGEPRRLSAAAKGSIRRKRLAARMKRKYPLFAEQFTQEELETRPAYYSGEEYDRALELDRAMKLRQRLAGLPAISVEPCADVVQAVRNG